MSSCTPLKKKSFTQRKKLHRPPGFAYKIIAASDTEQFDLVTYRGQDSADVFVERILEEQANIMGLYDEIKPMKLTPEQEHDFQAAAICHICKKPFKKEDVKVRDHHHKGS